MTATDVFDQWIRNPALIIDGDDDLMIPGKLLEAMKAARIIFLGEMNHFVHEKIDFRLQWLNALGQHFNLVLAEELGRSDGYRVNQYLLTGESTWLDRVPTFGYREDARRDRDDNKQGILKASSDNYPTALFKAEQVRFYQALRAFDLNINLHGIDINGSTTAGYLDILTRMAELPAASWQEKFRGLLQPEPGEPVTTEISRLTAVRAVIAPLLNTNPVIKQIDRDLQVMQASLKFFIETNSADAYQALSPSLADREDLMKAQASWLLEGLAADQKLVVMGHALHLVKRDAPTLAGSGPGGGVASSLGHYLSTECEEQVVSIWFLYGSGADSQPFPDLANVVAFPPGSLNHALLDLGGTRILLTDDPAIRGQVIAVGHMYNTLVEVDLAAQTDVIHFIPRVTPLRE